MLEILEQIIDHLILMVHSNYLRGVNLLEMEETLSSKLNFIPDLKNKTFLDIGSEEGYSVFNAIEKNFKFAKV